MDGSNGDEGESEPPNDHDETTRTTTKVLTAPTAEDASGFGLSMVLLTGVLLALAYYGTQAVADEGLGQAIPPPFYLLALALVFVLELSRSRSTNAQGLARAVGTTAVYGTLVILALEGGAYLWENPEVALDEWAGIAVLAVSLVVVALVYVVYLSALQTE
ncbi:hypothetical protein [Halobacterium wangiae]|uniref:hypothetical protein n=1 Tax=Halobacterium wangiae TaxID=2902623 RepID=UPI001E3303DF|nr:hypothetical protein [Halobacterium wangiae]